MAYFGCVGAGKGLFGEAVLSCGRDRDARAPANAALLDRLAGNLLELADAPKVPIINRIRKCMWDDDYVIRTCAHMR